LGQIGVPGQLGINLDMPVANDTSRILAALCEVALQAILAHRLSPHANKYRLVALTATKVSPILSSNCLGSTREGSCTSGKRRRSARPTDGKPRQIRSRRLEVRCLLWWLRKTMEGENGTTHAHELNRPEVPDTCYCFSPSCFNFSSALSRISFFLSPSVVESVASFSSVFCA